MIQENNKAKRTLKQIREEEKKVIETALKEKCEAYAEAKYTKEQIVRWSNEHQGLWFLPVLDEDGEIFKLSIMKPINRHILSHASTKLEDEGLYVFLEACMRECLVNDDEEGQFVLEDEESFISGSMEFNKILKGRKVGLLKR